ncbi:MAG: hypothetical protein ACM3S2_20220 [Ignavibacteriales bacterium]
MSKTIIGVIIFIISLGAVLTYWGNSNLREISRQIDAVKTGLSHIQDSIKITINNIDKAKGSIEDAKAKVDSSAIALKNMNRKLINEFTNVKKAVDELVEKRKLLDKKLAEILEKIPDNSKEVRRPDYKPLGVIR